ncbi:MAG: hypothetical protein CMN25_01120 [Salinicola sp.]|nr:glycosyltransferase [uncultured Tistrella sp.]MAM55919.1 hypothetical protein [Salinicola sp.]
MTCLTYLEPLTDGHCAFWAQMTLRGAAADPRVDQVRLVTGPEMAKRLEETVAATGLELEILPPDQLRELTQPDLLKRGRAQWEAARDCLGTSGGQLFLPFFDHAIYGALLDRRPVPGQVSGIIFRPPNGHNYPAGLRRGLDTGRRWGSYIGAQRPALRKLFTLDERAPRSAVSRMAGLLTFLPDPSPDLSLLENRTPCPRADGRRVLLLFGALAERKGIFVLLEALSHLSSEQRSRLALRFVGRVDSPDRESFGARLEAARAAYPEVAIELVDRFVSDSELAQEVVDCDVVLAPYQNHVGSSGVVFWAAAAGKPLIAQRTGLIGYQVERHGLGTAVDTTDAAALAAALERASPRKRNDTFLKAHSPDVFTQTILEGCFG